MTTFVILLRAIGPVTHAKMSMAAWRDASAAAGFAEPQTYVATGNMVTEFDGTAIQATQAMKAVLLGFGLGENVVPILRRPSLLNKLFEADPVQEAAQQRPAETGVYFFVQPKPDFSWIDAYDGPGKLFVLDRHLVVDFGQEVSKAGRLLRLIDKHCGISTARNWNTLAGLTQLCRARKEKD